MHSDGTEENKKDDQQRSRVEAAGAKDLNPRMRWRGPTGSAKDLDGSAASPDCKLGRLCSRRVLPPRFGAQHKQRRQAEQSLKANNHHSITPTLPERGLRSSQTVKLQHRTVAGRIAVRRADVKSSILTRSRSVNPSFFPAHQAVCLYQRMVSSDQSGNVSPVLRRILRQPALRHDWTSRSPGTCAVRGLARRRRGGGFNGLVWAETIFQQLGCTTCHRFDTQGRGPNLIGTFGKPVELEDGRVVTADENYVRESILIVRRSW